MLISCPRKIHLKAQKFLFFFRILISMSETDAIVSESERDSGQTLLLECLVVGKLANLRV